MKEDGSETSRNEGSVAENESHRVDEINLFEKFQFRQSHWHHLRHVLFGRSILFM